MGSDVGVAVTMWVPDNTSLTVGGGVKINWKRVGGCVFVFFKKMGNQIGVLWYVPRVGGLDYLCPYWYVLWSYVCSVICCREHEEMYESYLLTVSCSWYRSPLLLLRLDSWSSVRSFLPVRQASLSSHHRTHITSGCPLFTHMCDVWRRSDQSFAMNFHWKMGKKIKIIQDKGRHNSSSPRSRSMRILFMVALNSRANSVR